MTRTHSHARIGEGGEGEARGDGGEGTPKEQGTSHGKAIDEALSFVSWLRLRCRFLCSS